MYWKMFKYPSERAAHKKRLRSKTVIPKKISLMVTAFSRREQFFSGKKSFFISQKQLRPSIPRWIGVFFKEHLQPGIVCIQCI